MELLSGSTDEYKGKHTQDNLGQWQRTWVATMVLGAGGK